MHPIPPPLSSSPPPTDLSGEKRGNSPLESKVEEVAKNLMQPPQSRHEEGALSKNDAGIVSEVNTKSGMVPQNVKDEIVQFCHTFLPTIVIFTEDENHPFTSLAQFQSLLIMNALERFEQATECKIKVCYQELNLLADKIPFEIWAPYSLKKIDFREALLNDCKALSWLLIMKHEDKGSGLSFSILEFPSFPRQLLYFTPEKIQQVVKETPKNFLRYLHALEFLTLDLCEAA